MTEVLVTEETIEVVVTGGVGPAGPPGPPGSGGVMSVTAGTGISVDNTDPANPVVSATSTAVVESVTAGTGVLVDNTDPANPVVLATSTAVVESVVAGTNVTVDNTDPANPVVSAAGGSDAYRFKVSDYGAVGDGKLVDDLSVTNGSAVITSATAGFTSGDVGKTIMINGGYDAVGNPIIATINGYTSATQVTISIAATRTASNLQAAWGTDDTADINAAVAAAKAYALSNGYFAQIDFEPRIYMLASGPTQTTSPAVYNTQIPVPHPDVDGSTRKLVIAFKGGGAAGHAYYWRSTEPNLSGTVLLSAVYAPASYDGTYGVQSVIGGPSAGGAFTGGFANTKVVIEDLMVVCGAYTNLTAYDFTWLGGMEMESCSAHIFAVPLYGPEPLMNSMVSQSFFQSRLGVGLRTPANGNNADNSCSSLTVEGYTIGVKMGDHAQFDRLLTIYNDLAVDVDGSSGLSGVGHNLTIDNWAAEVYNGGLRVSGGYVHAHITMASECSGPSYDVSDVGNSLHGEIWWSDPADSREPVVTGAQYLTFHNNRRATIQLGGALYPRVITLSDAATIATDARLGNVFIVTLGGNRTLGAPTGAVDGQEITYLVVQDGTGSRTLSYNAIFDFGSSGAPTLRTTAGAVDLLRFVYSSTLSKWVSTGGSSGGGGTDFAMSFLGTLATRVGTERRYNDTGATRTLSKVRLWVNTAPTGADIIVDVLKNGSSIFTTKPRVVAGANTGTGVPTTTSWADGEYLTINIDQVGSTIAGADLQVTVVAQ